MIERNLKGQFKKGCQTRKHFPTIGKIYGNFTVISEISKLTNDQKVMFEVQCSCGKTQYVRAYFLESGRQTCCKSCSHKAGYKNGVEKGTIINKHKGVGNLTQTVYSYIKHNAEKRNIEWSEELTIEYLYNLLLSQNKKCALSGMDIDLTELRTEQNGIDFDLMTASLDRIDSKDIYKPSNIQWVHKDINRLKWAFDQSYFIEMCKKVVNHANQQPS